MNKAILYPLCASALFAAGTPASKALLGDIPPGLMAGLLYLGGGLGVLALRAATPAAIRGKYAAPLAARDFKWLAASIICGGIIAPLLLMHGLDLVNASHAAILTNLEIVFTILMAAALFKETVSLKTYASTALIVTGAVMLFYKPDGAATGSVTGQLAVTAACLFWAIDNNVTCKIAAKDPAVIAALKGIAAGSVNLLLCLPDSPSVIFSGSGLLALATGFVSYGLSLMFFISGMRYAGAAKATAMFGTYPLIAAVLSVLFLKEPVSWPLAASAAVCSAAVYLLALDKKGPPAGGPSTP